MGRVHKRQKVKGTEKQGSDGSTYAAGASSLVEHTVPRGQFSLNYHYCHAACGHTVCSAVLASTGTQRSYIHRGTVITNVCKSWAATCTCLYMQTDTCMMTHRHVGSVGAFIRACASSSHLFTWAGQGSFFFPLSLFFSEWEKAVSNFLLSTAGRCFSADSCNLFQLCVLIIACSWWYSSFKKKKKSGLFLLTSHFLSHDGT